MNTHELNQFKEAVRGEYINRFELSEVNGTPTPELGDVIREQVRNSNLLQNDDEFLSFVRNLRAWTDLILCHFEAPPIATMDPNHPLDLWGVDPISFGDWILDSSTLPYQGHGPRGTTSPPPPPFKATR